VLEGDAQLASLPVHQPLEHCGRLDPVVLQFLHVEGGAVGEVALGLDLHSCLHSLRRKHLCGGHWNWDGDNNAHTFARDRIHGHVGKCAVVVDATLEDLVSRVGLVLAPLQAEGLILPEGVAGGAELLEALGVALDDRGIRGGQEVVHDADGLLLLLADRNWRRRTL